MEHAKRVFPDLKQDRVRSNPRGKFVEGVEVYPYKRLQPAPSVRSDDPRERTQLESGIKRLEPGLNRLGSTLAPYPGRQWNTSTSSSSSSLVMTP